MIRKRKNSVMSIALIVLATALIVVTTLYIINQQTIQRQNEMIRLLQQDDISELLHHVRQVMAGEIIYEWDSEAGPHGLLAQFSFTARRRANHPTTHRIESRLTVLDINLEGDSGEMLVSYSISSYDSSGNLLSSRSASPITPDKWRIERIDGHWVIVSTFWYKEWAGD